MSNHAPEAPAFLDGSLRGFLDLLAGSDATPGGGSASALGGALGAALVSMVAGLTEGSAKYAEVHGRAAELRMRSEEARLELQQLVQRDAEAFAAFARAMKMPKGNDEERMARERAMEEALVTATEVPLQICRWAVVVCELSVIAAEIGNAAAVSDAGVAAVLAEAAALGASLNVDINVGYLKDRGFARQAEEEADALVQRAAALRREALAHTTERL